VLDSTLTILYTVIMTRSSLLPVLVLTSGLALLLAPAVAAIPPYVALEYLAIGGVCIASVIVIVLGRRIRDLRVVVGAMRRAAGGRSAADERGPGR
jgi:hypothetical protein